MTRIALMPQPIINTSIATREADYAAREVAMKLMADATTVMSLSTLRARFVDVTVVITAHPTIANATMNSGRRVNVHVRRFAVAHTTPSASNTIASARKASSFGN